MEWFHVLRRGKMIANVTATKDDEEIENGDVSSAGLAALLDYADEIVLHEVHDEEWVEDRKERYDEEWAEKVEAAERESEPETEEDEEDEEDEGDAPEVELELATGQTLVRSGDYEVGDYAAGERVVGVSER